VIRWPRCDRSLGVDGAGGFAFAGVAPVDRAASPSSTGFCRVKNEVPVDQVKAIARENSRWREAWWAGGRTADRDEAAELIWHEKDGDDLKMKHLTGGKCSTAGPPGPS